MMAPSETRRELRRISLLKLSEKDRRSLRGSLTEHLNGTLRPILASLRLPIPRSECCSYPISDNFSRLDFSHLGAPHSTSANGSINALRDFLRVSVRTPTRKKSLRPSKSAPAYSFSPNEEVELQACPKGTPRKVELEASQSGPFRSTASLVLPRERSRV